MNADAPIEERVALKPYHEMLVGELHEGLLTFQRSGGGLFLSSLSAGIDLSFSVLLIAVAHAILEETLTAPVLAFLIAGLYPIGFIFVILGRTELFTEQTTLAIVPVLHRKASLVSLGRLWGIVYVGNLLGMAAMVGLFTILGPALEVVSSTSFDRIAEEVTNYPAWVLFLSAVLAGWLMGLLSWLMTAARDTISQVVLVWLIAAMIGLGQLHHSIVGAGEVLAGVLSGQQVTMVDFAHFLLWATLGNILGGVVFALLLKGSAGIRGARLNALGAGHSNGERPHRR